MSGLCLALAGGAIMAMLAAPAAVDPCSDFRLALALENTASTVLAEALRAGIREFRETGSTTEAWAEIEAARDANREATDRVEGAMIAVRRTVADEARRDDRRNGYGPERGVSRTRGGVAMALQRDERRGNSKRGRCIGRGRPRIPRFGKGGL